MKFIFYTVPAYGHVNPVLGVAQELVARGHEVIFYSTLEFKKAIESTGARFQAPSISVPDVDLRITRDTLKMMEVSVWATKLILPSILKELEQEKPDCIVHDSLCVWGKIASLHTGIKTVSLTPSMAINAAVLLDSYWYLLPDIWELVTHPRRSLRVMHGFKSLFGTHSKAPFILDLFTNDESLNIVFTSEYFQIRRDSFDRSYHFVGPMIYDRRYLTQKLPPKTKKPVIYISLGTVHNDKLDFFRTCLQLFGNKNFEVYMSVGNHFKRAEFGVIPQNFHTAPYMPQLEILKKAALFISHGGMNSVNESLYYGVPLLLFPVIQEQKVNSNRVEKLGAGIYYRSKNLDQALLQEYVQKLLEDKSYQTNVRKIQQTLHRAGGVKKAVDTIEKFI